MTVDQVAESHYRTQVVIARRAARRLDQLWRQVDRNAIRGSWGALLSQAFTVLSGAQALTAAAAGSYVDAALEAQGMSAEATGRVVPASLAGVASDGRSLLGLLNQPATRALANITRGATVERALAAGRVELDMIARTQVADAGRVADGVAVVARPQVTGYVRMVVGKTCARCLLLAGRRYEWNAGFLRHPRCDCRHVPAAEDSPGDIRTNPNAYFASLSRDEQDRMLGKAGAEAARDGADLGRIVNARRGMYTAGGLQLTRTRIDRRRRPVRLMPEQIYQEAAGDREKAARLLRLHGYLT